MIDENTRRELEKIRDAVRPAADYHRAQDEMNAAGHLAAHVRYSPLTSVLETAVESLDQLLEEDK